MWHRCQLWSADRLQQRNGEGAASRGVHHEICRNRLAYAVAVLTAHAGDRPSIWRCQHFRDPTALAQRSVCAAFHPPSHGVLDCRPRRRVTGPTEIAMREGIVTRTLDANIETGPERFLLESREEFVQCALAAEQQPMHMPRLWRSRAECHAPEQRADRSGRRARPRP